MGRRQGLDSLHLEHNLIGSFSRVATSQIQIRHLQYANAPARQDFLSLDTAHQR
jgi:hypothetical protein